MTWVWFSVADAEGGGDLAAQKLARRPPVDHHPHPKDLQCAPGVHGLGCHLPSGTSERHYPHSSACEATIRPAATGAPGGARLGHAPAALLFSVVDAGGIRSLSAESHDEDPEGHERGYLKRA